MTQMPEGWPDPNGPGWTDVGRTGVEPTPVGMAGGEELPIVVGEVGPDGKVRVNEADLEPGRYRVRAGADGEVVGEVEVTDPKLYKFQNRAERRRNGHTNNSVHRRRHLQRSRWGRD